MKKSNEEIVNKQQATITKNRDKKKIEQQQLVKKIQEDAKNELMPALKNKMKEVAKYITERIEKNGEFLNSSQIMSLIARRSMVEIASAGNISYTPQEVSVAFNYYLDMVDKINQVKKFPPTIESFCLFLGITVPTYNNWLADAEKKNVMDYIHSYLLGALNTSTLTKEVETIAGIYTTKTMGKIEQQAPMIIEHKKVTDVDSIQAQIQALKGNNVIEADFEEVEKDDY